AGRRRLGPDGAARLGCLPVCGGRRGGRASDGRGRAMNVDPLPLTIEWADGAVRLVDQRRLPGELVLLECRTVDELCDAIRTLAVRGAPALGAAGAMGVALAAVTGEPLEEAAERLRATRPT